MNFYLFVPLEVRALSPLGMALIVYIIVHISCLCQPTGPGVRKGARKDQQLRQTSSVPVFGLYAVMLGYGIAGGGQVSRTIFPEAPILALYMSLSEA